jgi:asparagine synthase (glutamine-hydrolysing)
MCGVVGIVADKSNKNDRFIRSALTDFQYRGPDDKGLVSKVYSVGREVVFGHRRLSIQDLSNDGHQPFESQSTLLVFNGEIYNFKSLKQELQKDGEIFKSKSDTEVILKGYERHGIKYLDKLNGMFAIAIYCKIEKKVYLIRDRTGIKPMYYYQNNNTFAFCSEANILAKLTNKSINMESFDYYMRLGYIPGKFSLFSEVSKVLPGTYVELNLINMEITEYAYYQIPIESEFSKKSNLDVFKNVKSSIESQLISDVEVGVFLSGGLDSSIITAVAHEKNKNIKAFTSKFVTNDSYIKFNKDYEMAKLLSDKLNIDLEVVEIDDNNLSLMQEFYKYSSSLDEPQANLTGFSSYLITKRARELGVKVLLSGDGADEVFGGYNRYRLIMKMYKYSPFSYLHPKTWRYLFRSDIEKYVNLTSVLTKGQVKLLLNNKKRKLRISLPKIKKYKNKAKLINYFDLLYWIPDESNKRVDRASMLNSVEVRVPFQDHNLIKSYFSLPLSEKINKNNEKIFLKNAFKHMLPEEILSRKKTGWNAPDSKWFRGFLKPLLFETLSKENLRKHNLFDEAYVDKILHEHMSGGYYRQELKTLLSFQIWYNSNF